MLSIYTNSIFSIHKNNIIGMIQFDRLPLYGMKILINLVPIDIIRFLNYIYIYYIDSCELQNVPS